MTGWQPPKPLGHQQFHTADVHRKEVRYMTAFEIISVFIGILTLLCAFGSLIIALLVFLRKGKQHKK